MVKVCGILTLYLREGMGWEERPGIQNNNGRTRESLGVTVEDNVITCVHLMMNIISNCYFIAKRATKKYDLLYF